MTIPSLFYSVTEMIGWIAGSFCQVVCRMTLTEFPPNFIYWPGIMLLIQCHSQVSVSNCLKKKLGTFISARGRHILQIIHQWSTPQGKYFSLFQCIKL